MGCFSNCFGKKKRHQRRRRRPIKNNASLLHHLQTYESVEGFEVPQLIEAKQEEEEELEKAENQVEISPPPDPNDEKREKLSSSERKKVTFDLNVQVYEHLRTEFEEEEEEDGNMEEKNEEEELFKEEIYAKSSIGTQCNSDSSTSSLFSFPNNHRYRDFKDSDDEFDELLSSDESDMDDYSDNDDDDDDDYKDEVESEIKSEKQMKVEDQSSDSLFSLSLDSRKHELEAETEVNSPMLIRNSTNSPNESNSNEFDRKYVDSILNPVENLTQWKFVKAKSKIASKDHHHYNQEAKENIDSSQNVRLAVKKEQVMEKEIEIGVDTSLSTWLVGSPKNKSNDDGNSRSSSVSVGNYSPFDSKKNSPNKFEDRPILGALTLEEIRQLSASCSPRKSPSKSPEDVPIIGSVGSYWNHTAQTTDTGSSTRSTKSKYRESAEVIWDPTPFETRLEKALEKESNGEQVLAV